MAAQGPHLPLHPAHDVPSLVHGNFSKILTIVLILPLSRPASVFLRSQRPADPTAATPASTTPCIQPPLSARPYVTLAIITPYAIIITTSFATRNTSAVVPAYCPPRPATSQAVRGRSTDITVSLHVNLLGYLLPGRKRESPSPPRKRNTTSNKARPRPSRLPCVVPPSTASPACLRRPGPLHRCTASHQLQRTSGKRH